MKTKIIIKTKRKPLQFKYRNWWKNSGGGSQIAFLPHFDVWWNRDYIDEVGNMRDDQIVVCVIFAWLGFCFEFWINGSEDLI